VAALVIVVVVAPSLQESVLAIVQVIAAAARSYKWAPEEPGAVGQPASQPALLPTDERGFCLRPEQ